VGGGKGGLGGAVRRPWAGCGWVSGGGGGGRASCSLAGNGASKSDACAVVTAVVTCNDCFAIVIHCTQNISERNYLFNLRSTPLRIKKRFICLMECWWPSSICRISNPSSLLPSPSPPSNAKRMGYEKTGSILIPHILLCEVEDFLYIFYFHSSRCLSIMIENDFASFITVQDYTKKGFINSFFHFPL